MKLPSSRQLPAGRYCKQADVLDIERTVASGTREAGRGLTPSSTGRSSVLEAALARYDDYKRRRSPSPESDLNAEMPSDYGSNEAVVRATRDAQMRKSRRLLRRTAAGSEEKGSNWRAIKLARDGAPLLAVRSTAASWPRLRPSTESATPSRTRSWTRKPPPPDRAGKPPRLGSQAGQSGGRGDGEGRGRHGRPQRSQTRVPRC